MIDREQVEKCLKVMDFLSTESISLRIEEDGVLDLCIYPKNWWSKSVQWTEDRRHEVLAILTPLVGRLDKHLDGTDIGYKGTKDNLSVRVQYADKCKIVGYKKKIKQVAVTELKTVEKEEEVPTGETREEEELIPITDCAIREGKASEADIEVPA